MSPQSAPLRAFAARVALSLALIVALLFTWSLRHVLLLAFWSLLVGLFLTAISKPLTKFTPLPQRAAVIGAACLVVLCLAGLVAFFGFALQAQAAEVIAEAPRSWAQIEQRLNDTPLGSWAIEMVRSGVSGIDIQSFLSLRPYFAALGSLPATLLLVTMAGLYFALEPRLYRNGLLILLPDRAQAKARNALDQVGRVLQAWLLAQGTAMLTVGLLTTLGLWLVGVPAPLALGILAGLADFVPLVGPVVAAIPALLLAAPLGWAHVGWTAAVYVAVQQLEGNILLPVLQHRIVSLPPVLTLFALVGFGVLFGPLGVLLATPMTAATMVLVQQLYVRGILKRDL